ncbi:MAG: redoxin domain-containing protein [Planctomycetota bacterium]
MPPVGLQVGILALGAWIAATGVEDQVDPTAAAQFDALLKEYQDAGSGGSTSDEQRMALIARVYQIRHGLELKFVELAEKYPQEPIATDALIRAVWQVNTTPWPVEVVGRDSARTRAFALLQRDHLRSDKLGPICLRISFGFCKEYEVFLRAVLETSPHQTIQGLACLALAHFLSNRLQRLDLLDEQSRLAKEFADLFGDDYLAELRRQERTTASNEAEGLFARAIERHGQVKIEDGGTVGEKARAELFEMRHLVVGKEAPEIEGEDQDGKAFKLSDYRGKVVLLDFWHQA